MPDDFSTLMRRPVLSVSFYTLVTKEKPYCIIVQILQQKEFQLILSKKNNMKIHFYLSLVVLFFSTSISAQKDLAISVETGIIPPEFNKNNDTLLIFSGNPFYNLSMKKHFNKNYTGPFLIVKSTTGHSVENCRYMFYEGTSTNTKLIVDGPNKGKYTNNIQHSNFYIEDRKTKEEFGNSNLPSPKLIRAYISGLDKARQGL